MGQPNYADGFSLATHENMLAVPLTWKSARMIFVNSMSDLFHQAVPQEFIFRVFDAMNKADWHTYQILTKRSVRLKELSRHLRWQKHIWMGVSVETEEYVSRMDDLRDTEAHVKFVSLTPNSERIRALGQPLHSWAWSTSRSTWAHCCPVHCG